MRAVLHDSRRFAERIPHRTLHLALVVYHRHHLRKAENDVEMHAHDVHIHGADVEVPAQSVFSPSHDVGET